MLDLYCQACDSSLPLHAPCLVAGHWQAVCGDCLAINILVPDSRNVFLPVRFKVACVIGEHPVARPERLSSRPEP